MQTKLTNGKFIDAFVIADKNGITGITSIFKLPASTASTNATNVKTSGGRISRITCLNANSTTNLFLKLYNKASAPVVGTDVPSLTYAIPKNGEFDKNLGSGIYFNNGISFAFTTGVSDTDATAVAENDILAFSILYS